MSYTETMEYLKKKIVRKGQEKLIAEKRADDMEEAVDNLIAERDWYHERVTELEAERSTTNTFSPTPTVEDGESLKTRMRRAEDEADDM